MNVDQAALFIIDMQNDFVVPGSPQCVMGAISTVPNIVKVLSAFREHHRPVFHIVREYRSDGSDVESFRYDDFVNGKKSVVPGTKGCQIIEALTPLDGEYKIIKNRFSAFMNTELDLMLRRLGLNRIVITGTQYPNCVRATAFDAVSLGYEVCIITDATSAASEEIALANIIDLKNIGISCINSEALCWAT